MYEVDPHYWPETDRLEAIAHFAAILETNSRQPRHRHGPASTNNPLGMDYTTVPVECLDISRRTLNFLKRCGLYSLADLARVTLSDLDERAVTDKMLGRTTLPKLLKAMDAFDIEFAPEP